MSSLVTEEIYLSYLNALIAGDRIPCMEIVQELINKDIQIPDLYLNLFQRSLYRTGELWEQNLISVSVEHLATAITERLMALLEPKIFEGGFRSHSVIVACVADEYHQLGARMVADLFELNGWRGYFLGASTPVQDLLNMIDEKKPDIIALSLSIYFNLPTLLATLDRITTLHPDLPILVGGQAFRWGGPGALAEYPTVIYIPSIEVLESVMEQYHDQ